MPLGMIFDLATDLDMQNTSSLAGGKRGIPGASHLFKLNNKLLAAARALLQKYEHGVVEEKFSIVSLTFSWNSS